MPTSIELLPSIAPEIDCSSQQVLDLNALAELEVGVSLCPDLRPYLVAYLTAHQVTISNRGGVGGEIASMQEGQLTIAYKQGMDSSKDPLMSSAYGQEYKRLLNKCLGGVTFRTGVMPYGV
jgi:hypothetical protein